MIEIDCLSYTGKGPEVFFWYRGIVMSADLDPGIVDPVVILGSAVGFDVDVKFTDYRLLQREINCYVDKCKRKFLR
jgi:hypothetical protein